MDHDYAAPFERQVAELGIVCGTPKTVIAKLKVVLENMQTGILALWASDGKVSDADARTCIRLMGQEVVPAIREHGDRLGLKSPFDLETPVSTKFSKDLKPRVAA